jgi:hypothetical protein
MEGIRQIQAQIGDKTGSIACSKPSNAPMRPTVTLATQIRKRLVQLAISRRETLADLELLAFSKALEIYPEAAIDRVFDRLMLSEREEYEPKIPELGSLIAMVKTEVRKDNPWTPCGKCNSGMIVRDDGVTRVAERCECWLAWKRASEPA